MIETVPVFKPLLEEDDFDACNISLRNGWLGMGEDVGEFEEGLSNIIDAGDRKVVAVSTGHAALHLALLMIGVGPGDEVITPSFNNIADFQAIKAVGAEIVFCDIDPSTLCIDVDSAESMICQKTKVIIAMDYGLNFCDHEKIKSLSERYDIRIIHDAAHSFGSSYKGKAIGNFSDITMFSFDPVKNITSIDGGALVVKTDDEKSWLHSARLIGMGQPSDVMYQNKRAWTYDVAGLGFRYHMANLHAALGVAQLSKLDRIKLSRQETCRKYNEAFSNIHDIKKPPMVEDDVIPFIYYLLIPSAKRDEFRKYLDSLSIDTGIPPTMVNKVSKGVRKL